MYIKNYPEDSTLRRHCESAARFRRDALLAQPPTDSVLRRHYDQRQGILAARPDPAPTPPPTAPAEPAPTASAATMPPPARQGGGGILGWVRRIFG